MRLILPLSVLVSLCAVNTACGDELSPYPDVGCAEEVEIETPATSCVSSGIQFTLFTDPRNALDVGLIYSPQLLPSAGYAYMTSFQVNRFLDGLNADTLTNEYHLPWRDTQLNFNYFHRSDSTAYYGTFGSNSPDMRFFDRLPSIPVAERNHIDIYLNHYADGIAGDSYPAHDCLDDPCPDVKEDGASAVCDEYSQNAIQASAGFTRVRRPSNPWYYDNPVDSLWYRNGGATSVRIIHEMQHLLWSSRAGGGTAFPNETFSMAAEYLSGAQSRDAERPLFNSVYDIPITADAPGLAYNHWYLWSAYLLQQFAGDTTRIEDDLYYKYARLKDQLGNYKSDMGGVATILGDSVYDGLGLGSTANERLLSVFHNYSIAKWVDNPSPSFYGGRYGFSRGLDPSVYPGIFDNSFNPRDRRTAREIPPKLRVGLAQSAIPFSSQDYHSDHWCYTDRGQDSTGTGQRTACDTLGVTTWSADYIQFEADQAFEDPTSDTFHFQMNWDPASYPDPPGLPPLGRLRLHVSAITYSIRSDNLYAHGEQALEVIDAVIDTLTGTCSVSIPNFGTTAKSVVITIDLGEQSSPDIGNNIFKFMYDYTFWVTPDRQEPSPPRLYAYRGLSGTTDSLAWADDGGWGPAGYYVQSISGDQTSVAVVDSTNPGETSYVRQITPGSAIHFYRILPKFTSSGGVSNSATAGGHVDQSEQLGGYILSSGDITVDAGDTLSLAPGTHVAFSPHLDSQQAGSDHDRCEVTVNGALRCIGSTPDSVYWESAADTPSPGDWRGLVFNSPGAGSRLEYSVIRHAYHGIQVAGTQGVYTFKIYNTRVQHSQFYGVYFQGGYPEMMYSVLEQNHGAEVAVTNSGSAKIWKCILRHAPELGAGAVDDGAVYSVGGGGTLRYSTIDGTGTGVYCVSASPWLRGVASSPDSMKYGGNVITNFLDYGVRTQDNASPNLGKGDATQYFSGHNNIYTSDSDAPFVSHSGTTQLQARWNYWGSSPPDLGRFVGSIDGPSSAYLGSYESPSGAGFNPAAAVVTGNELALEAACQKEDTQDYEGASAAFRDIIRDHPREEIAPQALERLVAMQIRNGRAREEMAFVKDLTYTTSAEDLRRVARRLEPRVLLAAGETDSAFAEYARLSEGPDVNRPSVLFEVALAKGVTLGDREGARAAVMELQRSSPDVALMKHARAMLSGIVGDNIWSTEQRDAGRVGQASGGYELFLGQSVPNPMNPYARIEMAIPTRGRVVVRVFDVHGRLVRILADAVLPAGRHVVEWDGRTSVGTNVSSGVYYYRLEFGHKKLVRKMIVLR